MKRTCVEVIPTTVSNLKDMINDVIREKELDSWELVNFADCSSANCIIITFEKEFKDDDDSEKTNND